jgi:MFS family permease
MPPETSALHTQTHRRVGPFIVLTVFLDLIGFGIVLPLMPFYVKTMGGSAETVGLLLSCFALTQLVATPLLGRLSDRIGRRPVILISLAGNALAMCAFALATKMTLLPLLFISRIVAGATAGNVSTCQAAIADVTSGADRAKAMGRLGAAMGLGVVFGPMVGSLLSRFAVWAPPLGAAAAAFLAFAGAAVLMPETRHHRPPEVGRATASQAPKHVSLVTKLREKRVVIVLGVNFLVFLCMSNMQVALTLLANVRLGWGAQEVARMFGFFGGVMFVVQALLIKRLSKVYGPVELVAGGALAMILGMLVVAQAHTPFVLVPGIWLVGFGFGITVPTLSSVASDVAGAESRGAILGFAQSAGGLARTVGPVLGGILFARVGPAAPFVGAAGAAALWLVLAVSLRRELAADPSSATWANDGGRHASSSN